MKHLSMRRMLHLVATVTFTIFLSQAQAQTTTARTISTGPNSNGFLEYLPAGYTSNTWETYPLIVFIHGIGECGSGSVDDLNRLRWTGPNYAIQSNTFPQSITVNGQTFKFLVISPQFVGWPSPQDLDNVINYALSHYRVNVNRVYLTGLSMGAGAVADYIGMGSVNTSKLAAAVPFSIAAWPDHTRARTIAATNLPIWAFHNVWDNTVPVSNTQLLIDQINEAPAPNPIAKKTIFQAAGHDCWTAAYHCQYTEGGMNIYQWMLQYQRGSTTPPPPAANQAPTSYAGADLTITLPANSVTLNGAGFDPEGAIASYNWTKVSGPAGETYTSANAANTTVNNLSQGTYVFRLTITDNKGATGTDDLSVFVNAGSTIVTPPSSSSTFKIEAENYTNMSGVLKESCWDAGLGQDVHWIENGDWMDYSINPATAGTYTLNMRLAAPAAGGQFQIRKTDGAVLQTVTVPNTGGYQTWQTVTTTVTLAAGAQTIRFVSTATPLWNFNWMEFVAGGSTPNPTPTPTPTPGVSSRIEAENYTNMYGVLKESCWDAGLGQDVHWIENNDWMEYSVNVNTAGNYTMNFRIAAPDAGAQFQVRKADGTVLATVNLTSTGGWQSWQTVTATVPLVAGVQTIRIVSTTAPMWNFNWVDVVGGSSSTTVPSTPATTFKIEAENYTNMTGVYKENCWDAGLGQDVHWIENTDWMDYSINPSAAGNYTVNFRIAAPGAGGQFQVRKADGTVLQTVTVPNTGGWQVWQTISATLSLTAGQQTIRIVSTATPMWNFNWMEFVPATTGTTAAKTSETGETEIVATTTGIQVFPNPIQDRFMLKVTNAYTGKMTLQVVDMKGAVVKTFTVSKPNPGTIQTYLSIGELNKGTYVLKLSMKDDSQTVSISKQ